MNFPASADDVRRWWDNLAALHPTGRIATVRYLGDEAARFSSAAAPGPSSTPAPSAVLLAPSWRECLSRRRLLDLAREAAHGRTAETLVCAIAPAPWRSRVETALRKSGLETVGCVAFLPNMAAPRMLATVARGPLQYVLANDPGLLRRGWGRIARWLPGLAPRLLAQGYPDIGLIALPVGKSHLAEWIRSDDGARLSPPAVVVRPGWRRRFPAQSVICFPAEGTAEAVAKQVSSRVANTPGEGALLDALGPAARAAGVRVPVKLDMLERGDRVWLVQSAIPGVSAAIVLRREPQYLTELLEALGRWLEAWNAATLRNYTLDEDRIQRDIIGPAQKLAEAGLDADYVARLIAEAQRLKGSRLPLVASHNDLTTSNILTTADGPLGIIDWETARLDGYPLTDLSYAVTDAVWTASSHQSRAQAFLDCFDPAGQHHGRIAAYESRLRAQSSAPAAWFDLCFHLGWLHHAVNEFEHRESEGPRPFLEVLEAVERVRPISSRL